MRERGTGGNDAAPVAQGMINYACRFFRASRPCVFNKSEGAECPSCRHASEFGDRILFIKLDAIGDVLRSASLLPPIAARHSRPYIAWLTRKDSVELVGMLKGVDEVIELGDVGLARAMTGGWTQVYSLSNDMPSASLASLVPCANLPVGFYVRNGVVTPSNEAAERWLEMAAFDRVKRENSKSYQERMLAILGAEAEFAPPALVVAPELARAAASRVRAAFHRPAQPRLAVNIGAGARWPKKMLDAAATAAYVAAARQQLDLDVMLVGGAAEEEKARAILAMLGGDPHIQPFLTPGSIAEFAATLMLSDVLFCGDTLALHIATAIGLPAVAIFGPTSAAEIADFDGLVAKSWARGLDCLGCYGDCAKSANCMTALETADLVSLTAAQLKRARRRDDPGAAVAAQ